MHFLGWRNPMVASLAIYTCIYYSMRHVATNLKFGSCTALSSSSPVIEALKPVTIEVESRSQTPSRWLRRLHQCCLYTVNALHWRPFTICTIRLCSYWDVVKCFIKQENGTISDPVTIKLNRYWLKLTITNTSHDYSKWCLWSLTLTEN